jgi:hypothetical protein
MKQNQTQNSTQDSSSPTQINLAPAKPIDNTHISGIAIFV